MIYFVKQSNLINLIQIYHLTNMMECQKTKFLSTFYNVSEYNRTAKGWSTVFDADAWKGVRINRIPKK